MLTMAGIYLRMIKNCIMWATKCKLKASKQIYQNNMFPVMIVAIVQALTITNSSHTAMPNAGLCRKDNFDRNAGNLRDNSFSFFSIHAGSITISSNSWSINRIGSKYINIKVIPFYIFVSNSAKSVLLASIRILQCWLPRKMDSRMVTWNVLSFHNDCKT